MRAITKGKEPRSLVEHRATTHADYSNYADKDGLRSALVRDQRGLCCYCMNRIEASGSAMKVEHWRCQSRNADLELSYSNLLAACLGGHSQPEALQHCDTRKGEHDLKFNPANGAHRIEQRIGFEMNGTVTSSDPDFNAQLNAVLNLNLPLLKNCRKGVLTAILDWWRTEQARLRGPVPTEQIARERARRAGEGAGHLTPFGPVAVWWLDQRLTRGAS
ncbi:MAG: TIGR02646 family protein [Deltaproteobacteria bacterium]|nr:TIGR02646 family protein [Deltaproteobacteria bacterium]